MRLAAYCRVSTDHAEQLDSLENQKTFFADFARLHQYELVRVYADEGISGKQLKKRDQFQQMLHDATTGAFEAVAVKDIARFARNTLDFLHAIRTLKRYQVVVLFVTNNMSTYGDSEFMLTIFGAIAQEESINTSKRVRFGKKINAQRGRVPNLVYGYTRRDLFTLQIQEEEAETVRRVFAMARDGYSMQRIAQALNSAGIPTRKGCLWDARNIRRMLQNPLYKGEIINHKSETRDVLEGTRTALPPAEWYHHMRPEYAVIEPALFDAVQDELARRKAMRQRQKGERPARHHSSAHLFSNLLVCAECGGSFSRKRYPRKHDVREFWVCRRRDQGVVGADGMRCRNQSHIDEHALQDFVRAYFAQCIADWQTFLQDVRQGYLAAQDKTDPAAAQRQLHAEQTRLQQARERLLTLYTDGMISLAECKRREAQNRDAQQEAARALARLQQDNAPDGWIEQTVRGILRLEQMTNAGLKQLIDRIEIADGARAYLYIPGEAQPVAAEESGALNPCRRRSP